MLTKPVRGLVLWFRRFHRDGGGQDILEWTLGLPIFVLLCAGIAFYAWTWWNQVTAAAAIHDGVYLAAKAGGDPGLGYAQTQSVLRHALGPAADAFNVGFAAFSDQRSFYGYITNDRVFSIPFLGPLPMTIRASSFQRQERFYGGDPGSGGWW